MNNAELKEVFTYLKGIKDILGIKLSSYFIKKVLLMDEMKEEIKSWNDDKGKQNKLDTLNKELTEDQDKSYSRPEEQIKNDIRKLEEEKKRMQDEIDSIPEEEWIPWEKVKAEFEETAS